MNYQLSCPPDCPQQHHLGTIELDHVEVGQVIVVPVEAWNFAGWLNMAYQMGAHVGKTAMVEVLSIEEADWEIDGAAVALRTRVAGESSVYMTDFYAHLACEARSDAPPMFLMCGCNAYFHGFPELPACPVCGCDELVQPELPNWTGVCPQCSSTFWWTEGSMYPDEHRHDVLRAEWAAMVHFQAKIARNHDRLEELFQAILAENRLHVTESGWVFLMAPRTVAVKS